MWDRASLVYTRAVTGTEVYEAIYGQHIALKRRELEAELLGAAAC